VERGRHDVRDSVAFFAAWQERAVEKQAQKKLLTFLQDAGEVYRFKMILKEFYKRMVMI